MKFDINWIKEEFLQLIVHLSFYVIVMAATFFALMFIWEYVLGVLVATVLFLIKRYIRNH
jgi:hypothetical protein